MAEPRRVEVLILGAGFAGVTAARGRGERRAGGATAVRGLRERRAVLAVERHAFQTLRPAGAAVAAVTPEGAIARVKPGPHLSARWRSVRRT